MLNLGDIIRKMQEKNMNTDIWFTSKILHRKTYLDKYSSRFLYEIIFFYLILSREYFTNNIFDQVIVKLVLFFKNETDDAVKEYKIIYVSHLAA